jgi:hypothetical protein
MGDLHLHHHYHIYIIVINHSNAEDLPKSGEGVFLPASSLLWEEALQSRVPPLFGFGLRRWATDVALLLFRVPREESLSCRITCAASFA